jgi:hypothetical protein
MTPGRAIRGRRDEGDRPVADPPPHEIVPYGLTVSVLA